MKNIKFSSLQPNEEQAGAEMQFVEIGSDSEIMSSAYEPRYKIIALGSVNGYVFMYDEHGYSINSTVTTGSPICSIIPCPNTSSFVSFYSPYLFKNHPHQKIAEFRDKYSKSQFPNYSQITHWVIENQNIKIRTENIKQNITSAALSPFNPLYLLFSTNDGSIFGFSIEDMSVTELYIDAFKPNLITCLQSINIYCYYVCHENGIEILNLQNCQISKYSDEKVLSIDIHGDYSSVITEEGLSKLLKKGKEETTFKTPSDSKCIYSSYIDDNNQWINVFRYDDFDQIYINNKLYKELTNDFIVPNLLIDYSEYFDKIGAQSLVFATTNGSLIFLNDENRNRDTFIPIIEQNFVPYLDGNNLFIVEHNNITNGCDFYVFREFTYFKKVSFQCTFPLAFKNSNFLCLKNNNLILFDPIDDDETSLFNLPGEIFCTHSSRDHLYIVLTNNKMFVIDLHSRSFSFEYVDSPGINSDTISWCVISKVNVDQRIFAQITHDNTLKIGDKSIKKFLVKKSKLLFMDIIGIDGKISTNDKDNYLLIVSSTSIKTIEPISMKLLIKMKFKEAPIDATVTDWGSLLLLYTNRIEILYLPNVKHEIHSFLPITDQNAVIKLIPYVGAVVMSNGKVTVYAKDIVKHKLSPDNPPIVLDTKRKRDKLLGTPTKKTIVDIGKAFHHQRITKDINDTANMLQELLINAHKITEKLNEMENKSLQIIEKSRKFYEESKKFRKREKK